MAKNQRRGNRPYRKPKSGKSGKSEAPTLSPETRAKLDSIAAKALKS